MRKYATIYCFVLHTEFLGEHFFTAQIQMDEFSCTNCFELPRIVINTDVCELSSSLE